MDSPALRASDADRERTVAVLQQEVGTDRLTLDEYSERSAAAYGARTVVELVALTRDLPHPTPAGPPEMQPARMLVLLTLALLLAVTLLTLAGPLAACH